MSDISMLNLQPGQIVGGYMLMSPLGGGGMGSVWRVQDGGGNVFAMKILRDSLAATRGGVSDHEQEVARERLRREGAALRRVNHPGVCRIVDMELDDSLAFIVTELIEGMNLAEDVATNGRYEPVDLMHLAQRLIDAVDAVHAAGIIHRDIKPSNVMIADSGPVLVDFGIAMGEGESHVTRTGMVMGTPGFIAPEIINGSEADEATDWWSVASVLAFAGTGRPIFGTKPLMTVLEREASGHANLVGLGPHTTNAMRSALSPDRMRRCSARELLDAIVADATMGAARTASAAEPPSYPVLPHKHLSDADGGASGTAAYKNTDTPEGSGVSRGSNSSLPPAAGNSTVQENAGVVPPFSASFSTHDGARGQWRDAARTMAMPTGEEAEAARRRAADKAEQIQKLLNGDFDDYDYGADAESDGDTPEGSGMSRGSTMPGAGGTAGETGPLWSSFARPGSPSGSFGGTGFSGSARRADPDAETRVMAPFDPSQVATEVLDPPAPTMPSFGAAPLRADAPTPLALGDLRGDGANEGDTADGTGDGEPGLAHTRRISGLIPPPSPSADGDGADQSAEHASDGAGESTDGAGDDDAGDDEASQSGDASSDGAPFDMAHYIDAWSNAFSLHGTAPALFIGATLGVLSMPFPGFAAIIGPALLVAFTTAGFALHARFTREAKRGGHAQPADKALDVLAAPWHLIQGLAVSAAGIVLFEAIFLTVAVMSCIASGPALDAAGNAIGIHLSDTATMPVAIGESNTTDAVWLAVAGAAAWGTGLMGTQIVKPLRRFTTMTRIGLGTLCVRRGEGASGAADPQIADHSHIALIVWGVVTAILAIAVAAGIPINWAPLTVA